MAPDGDNSEDDPDIHTDSPTGVSELGGTDLTFFPDDPALSRCGEWKGIQPFHPATQDDSEVREAITTRMIEPSQQLAELLSQIDRDVTSTAITRGYATRRKNACGALKLLSAKLENRIKICWTTGVLDAISSVLQDVTAQTADVYSANANVEARNRIVSVLLNLSAEKKNRMLICNHTKLLSSIVATIHTDEGESRQGCCTVLLYLAKTSETRPLLIKCPGLIEAMVSVIDVPRIVSVSQPKKMYENRFLKEFESPIPPVMEGDATNTWGTAQDIDQDSSSSVSGSSDGTNSESGSETHVSNTHSSENSQSSEENLEVEEEESQDGSDGGIKLPKMEICFKTPVNVEEQKKLDEVDYDADPNRFLHGARLSVFAALLCLVKNKDNAVSCIC